MSKNCNGLLFIRNKGVHIVDFRNEVKKVGMTFYRLLFFKALILFDNLNMNIDYSETNSQLFT